MKVVFIGTVAHAEVRQHDAHGSVAVLLVSHTANRPRRRVVAVGEVAELAAQLQPGDVVTVEGRRRVRAGRRGEPLESIAAAEIQRLPNCSTFGVCYDRHSSERAHDSTF